MPGLLMPPFTLLGGAAALAEPPYAFANAEAETLVAAMTVAPNGARKALIDTFIGALKTAGLWSKIDVMWVLAAHDEQAGRLNWKSPGNFTLTAVNTVTFTVDRGFAGDGSSGYLDTGWHAGTHAVQFTRDNASVSVYQRTGGGNGNATFSQDSPHFRISAVAGTGTGTRARVNSASDHLSPAGGTQPLQGIGRRIDASYTSMIRDGVEVVSPTVAASTGFGTGNMRFCVMANATFSSAQVAGGHLGAYLDDSDCASFYGAWHNYMTAVGADT